MKEKLSYFSCHTGVITIFSVVFHVNPSHFIALELQGPTDPFIQAIAEGSAVHTQRLSYLMDLSENELQK